VWSHWIGRPVEFQEYLLASTLIFPALLLFLVLLFVYICKVILLGIRFFTMYFLELLTERSPKEFMPFTLLAAAADILLLIANTLLGIIHCF
jgi:hypothetical protein